MKNKVVLIDEENNSLINEKLKFIHDDSIETDKAIYPMENIRKYFNESETTMYYYVNVALPDRVETRNLKNLRRNLAIHNLFNYQTKKGISISALMPYIIIILLILFK